MLLSVVPAATRSFPRQERVYSFRDKNHRWDPKNQRPELWNLYNGRKNPGESIRVFPLSNWTELDIWQYIYREQIPIVPLYFAAERPVVERDGMLMMVDDDRLTIYPNEQIQIKKIRFRTSAAIPHRRDRERRRRPRVDRARSSWSAKTSERQGRMIDSDSSARWKRKSRRATSDVAQTQNNSSSGSTPTSRAGLARHAPVHHLRLGRRRRKSTLIGRMLFEAQLIFEDQVASLKSDSKKMGTQGGRHRLRAPGRRARRRA